MWVFVSFNVTFTVERHPIITSQMLCTHGQKRYDLPYGQ